MVLWNRNIFSLSLQSLFALRKYKILKYCWRKGFVSFLRVSKACLGTLYGSVLKKVIDLPIDLDLY